MAATGRALQKLFVGNLHWTIGHRELREYFREFGRVVQSNVVFDKKTGLSKGYGFIVIQSQSNIIQSIESRSRLSLEGQKLTIQKAT